MKTASAKSSLRKWMALAGAVWMVFGAAILVFLLQYLCRGAGAQLFGFLDVPGRIVFGWIHVMGLLMLSGICFAVGIALFAFDPK